MMLVCLKRIFLPAWSLMLLLWLNCSAETHMRQGIFVLVPVLWLLSVIQSLVIPVSRRTQETRLVPICSSSRLGLELNIFLTPGNCQDFPPSKQHPVLRLSFPSLTIWQQNCTDTLHALRWQASQLWRRLWKRLIYVSSMIMNPSWNTIHVPHVTHGLMKWTF